jgi:hypothetical protein
MTADSDVDTLLSPLKDIDLDARLGSCFSQAIFVLE